MKLKFIGVLASFIFSGSVLAASGSAVIPNFVTDGTGFYTYIYLSNITEKDVNVEVDLYAQNGTIITDNNVINTGVISMYPTDLSDYTENAEGNTAVFTIPAHKSYALIVKKPAYDAGHGFIRWKQDSTRRQALVAHARVYRGQTSRENVYAVPINNGMPF
ncbi:hypothetical protein SG34_009565 [Thalassomonas viridans]|uniref:Uncharacterized protein n=1 Tax=Thalassomonas viridans TaxID=137584 RepID=A0AAF0CC43_9GAMM|nr:hypothetical protein [Thalassomonas viridans]WDE07109.1 hypothetical protein SG34_009565 [Thalassomonas viridans]